MNQIKFKHLKDVLKGRDMSKDWNVPYWNIPAAQDFIIAERKMKAAYSELVKLEEEIDAQERQQIAEELGNECGPTEARLAKARFESHEWRQAWQNFLEAVQSAQQAEQQWREEIVGKAARS